MKEVLVLLIVSQKNVFIGPKCAIGLLNIQFFQSMGLSQVTLQLMHSLSDFVYRIKLFLEHLIKII